MHCHETRRDIYIHIPRVLFLFLRKKKKNVFIFLGSSPFANSLHLHCVAWKNYCHVTFLTININREKKIKFSSKMKNKIYFWILGLVKKSLNQASRKHDSTVFVITSNIDILERISLLLRKQRFSCFSKKNCHPRLEILSIFLSFISAHTIFAYEKHLESRNVDTVLEKKKKNIVSNNASKKTL